MKKIVLLMGGIVTLMSIDMSAMLLRAYRSASLRRSAPTQNKRTFTSPSSTATVEQQKQDPKDLLQARAQSARLQQGNFENSEERLRWLNFFFQPVTPLSRPLSGEEKMQTLLEKLESEKNSVRIFYEQACNFYNAFSKRVESSRFSPQVQAEIQEKWGDHKAISAERLKQLDDFSTQTKKAKQAFEKESREKDDRIRELENELNIVLDLYNESKKTNRIIKE